MSMKMIIAVVRPEKVYEVVHALAEEGHYAVTKWSVAGRGKQKGIMVGDFEYEEMSKTALMIEVPAEDKDEVIDIIMQNALSGENGNSGDGRIFVLPVEEAYTISTQSKD